jgi:hypothetical protein
MRGGKLLTAPPIKISDFYSRFWEKNGSAMASKSP